MNILEQLSKKTKFEKIKKKADTKTKLIFYTLQAIIYASGILATSNYFENRNELRRTKEVVEILIEKNSENSKAALLNLLKEDPKNLDLILPNSSYKIVSGLDNLFLKKEKKTQETFGLEEKITKENPHVVKINSNIYFSTESISNKVRYLPKVNLVYDRATQSLYNLDNKNQRLEKIISNMQKMIEIDDSIYFILDNTLFEKKADSKITPVANCDDNCNIKSIFGIDIDAYIFSNMNEHKLLSSKDMQKEDVLELEELIKYIPREYGLNYGRFVYKNHALYLSYLNQKDNITKIGYENKKPKVEVIKTIYRNIEDFYVQDIDNDKKNDIIYFDCGEFIDTFHSISFKEDKYIENIILRGGTCESWHNFDYNQTNLNWLNQDELKEKIKLELFKK